MKRPSEPESRERYWFPAKRYGWGWGAPATWEGWLVFVGYLALLGLGALWLMQDESNVVYFLLYTFSLSGVLILVCWQKGEPPRWRWGKDS